MKKKAVFSWSGGKDSALALYKVLQEDNYDIVALLTTINRSTLDSSIHLIPVDLLLLQAKSIGIPLYTLYLNSKSMEDYESAMKEAIHHFKSSGVDYLIFGDIFLHDVKAYRENFFHPYDIEIIEPLWNKSSEEIITEFLKSGLQARIIITQADKLNENYAGRLLDQNLVDSLPEGVDPCGENGEYHSFVYDGPLFSQEIKFIMDEPMKLNYDIKLDDGQFHSYTYWQTKINPVS